MNARNKMKKENPQKSVMAWEEPWWSRGFCMDSVGASTQRYKIGIIRQILYSIEKTHPR
jgi:hypothetical protein